MLLNLNFDGALLFCAFISFNLAPAVRREDGTEFKVLSLKAIRAAVNRYLRQHPNNKPWSIVGDSAFQKSNKVLNAICQQMMQEGKRGPTLHKNAITSEQLQQLYRTGQLGEWDTLDPSQILRAEWFYITFYFGKRWSLGLGQHLKGASPNMHTESH